MIQRIDLSVLTNFDVRDFEAVKYCDKWYYCDHFLQLKLPHKKEITEISYSQF